MIMFSKYKYLVLRITSVLLDIVFSFVQPKIFTSIFSKGNVDFLLLIYGLAVYFVFFDFGFSKLSYTKIRHLFVSGASVKREVASAVVFLLTCVVVISGCYIISIQLLSFKYLNSFSSIVLLVFGLNISLNIYLTYLKSIFNAVDLYAEFEMVDIGRKILFIATICLLFIDESMMLSVTVLFICTIGCVGYLIKQLLRKFEISRKQLLSEFASVVSIFKESVLDSKDIAVFAICETVIYYIGFTVLPIFCRNSIGEYALWQKVFFGLSVFMRIICDVKLPAITRLYIQGKGSFAPLKRLMNSILVLSIGCVFVGGVVFYIIGPKFMQSWTNGMYQLSAYSLIALIIFCTGNAVQHVSGSMLLSVGGFFTFLRKTSLVIMLIIVFVFAGSIIYFESLPITLLLYSITYLAGSLAYYTKMKTTLTAPKSYE